MVATIKSLHVPSPSTPGQQGHASARATIEVVALTARDDFLLELGQLLDGSAAIVPVESTAQAHAAAARSKRAQVLVVDSRGIDELRKEIDQLLARLPALSALVFAEQDSEAEVAAALKGSRVFAVLPLPIDPRKTSAVFEGAVADAESRLDAARAAGAEARQSAVPGHKPAAGVEPRAVAAEPATAVPQGPPPELGAAGAGGSKIKVIALAGIACLVVAAAAAWYLTREEAPVPAEAIPISAGPDPAPAGDASPDEALPAAEGDVDELLEKARLAMRERRFIEPENNSALLYYRSAAQADPGNGEALDGLNRLRPVILANFDELAKAGRHDDAAGALARFAVASPGDPVIAGMRLRLAAARIAKAIDEGDAERATALVRSAQAANDVPAAQLAKWRAEISRMTEKAKQEQLAERQARDVAAAEQKVREARAAEAAREAQAARERESAKKLEAERAAQAAQATAKSAEAEAKAQKKASQRVEPKLKRNVTPDFPADAFDKGLSGVVTVAYTVDVEGRTQDVRIESSDPPGVFDEAATSAVKRWRFEPATVDGVPTEARLRISIRFTLPK
jgi:periplasmic protein TonB